MMMMISYIINEQRKEERYKVLVKRDEQKHEYILIYWGENLLSFLSLSEEETRREHDDERAYTHKTKQNKTNAPLNGGIFELSSNWWSFAFLIGTTNCCARRWTTTGRQTYCVCVFVRVLSFFGGAITKTKPKQSTRAKKRDFSMTLVFGALGTAKRTLFVDGAAPTA
jgi:hypothetical protein